MQLPGASVSIIHRRLSFDDDVVSSSFSRRFVVFCAPSSRRNLALKALSLPQICQLAVDSNSDQDKLIRKPGKYERRALERN